MNASRRAILDRLSTAPASSSSGQTPAQPLPAVIEPVDATPAGLVERLTLAFDRLGVTWDLVDSPVATRLKLAAGLKTEGIKRIVAWSAEELPVPGVLEALGDLGVEVILPNLRDLPERLRPQDPARREELLNGVETAEIGITGAEAAIAETGTILLSAGPGRPLLVSQMPRRHVVLLAASRVYPTLETWLAARRQAGEGLARTTCLTAVTGVSRALDIELHPSVGVHGPRRRHVLIVQGP